MGGIGVQVSSDQCPVSNVRHQRPQSQLDTHISDVKKSTSIGGLGGSQDDLQPGERPESQVDTNTSDLNKSTNSCGSQDLSQDDLQLRLPLCTSDHTEQPCRKMSKLLRLSQKKLKKDLPVPMNKHNFFGLPINTKHYIMTMKRNYLLYTT